MDLISRQDTKDMIKNHKSDFSTEKDYRTARACVNAVPSAQPERDKPMKPIETTDRAWGMPKKQAVCPKCDYYLGHVSFLGEYKGKRITYCETCGQAIDWEGWDFDE